MLFNAAINGSLLPEGTLCLTYDDGPGVTSAPMPLPGPRTDDLAFYLFLQGIPATFFVIGEYAAGQPDLCSQLTRWGHLVVNHTQTHFGLPWEGAAAVADVVTGGVSIGAATNSDSLLLRPPYGAWSDAVAALLNADTDARKYTGPILYDIGANDWTYWQNPNNNAASVQLANCVSDYYAQITNVGSGIIDLHDYSQASDPVLGAANQTYEMTRLLIPLLIADGYRFIRLDAVPQVRSAMQVSSIIGLKAASGLYISPQNGGGSSIVANGQGLYKWEELGIVDLGAGDVAIRTPNGQFMSVQPSGVILANGDGIYEWERFQLLPQGTTSVALKAWNGNCVSAPNSGQIMASTPAIEQFIVEYVYA